ncbi:hypothetical protein D9758_012303 [Tetrapyrgos nigripes]|uniref:Uncharacterized protein n=1 Tax=Tetrapyrgos nigripes TaxID=182062 RepID=A0A8H5CH82_9AGAR|nr:hypothetical protein D9758_012303 [Tetrapyrgos nigripes]
MPEPQPQPLSTVEGFFLGGLAACGAVWLFLRILLFVTISNPAEVAKTRLQLQGELAKDGGTKVYRNTFDVLGKTFQNEGKASSQARAFEDLMSCAHVDNDSDGQLLVNGVRLGFYEPMRQLVNQVANIPKNEQNVITSVVAGAATGAIGASMGNPMFLIKARMQAYSPALPVGTQHLYKNSIQALTVIIRQEGLRGLLRGMNAAVLRTSMGSSVQVPSYVWAKKQFVDHGILPADSFWTFMASSSVSGLVALAVMQPTDTVCPDKDV